MYPNPSVGIFNLIISAPVNGVVDIYIYDSQDKKNEKEFPTSPTSNKFSLDLSGFAKGMYFLNVQINGTNLIKKLIRL